MKSFISLSVQLTFLLVLISTVVNGMPISARGVDDEPNCEYESAGAKRDLILESRALHPKAAEFIKWLGTNKATVASIPAILFSGRSGAVHSQKGARMLAQKYKGATIGDLTRKANIKYTGWTKEDFRQVCKVWTDNAAGTAYVSLGKVVSSQSTWITTELPSLKANKAVKKIMASTIDEKGALGPEKDVKK
ncbi:hypothetical protein C8J56DRAFT_1166293 [Mycena floridula]|nr:hypothetical protein C8J56DRAFT_1166293 [Mycena floridula]